MNKQVDTLFTFYYSRAMVVVRHFGWVIFGFTKLIEGVCKLAFFKIIRCRLHRSCLQRFSGVLLMTALKKCIAT